MVLNESANLNVDLVSIPQGNSTTSLPPLDSSLIKSAEIEEGASTTKLSDLQLEDELRSPTRVTEDSSLSTTELSELPLDFEAETPPQVTEDSTLLTTKFSDLQLEDKLRNPPQAIEDSSLLTTELSESPLEKETEKLPRLTEGSSLPQADSSQASTLNKEIKKKKKKPKPEEPPMFLKGSDTPIPEDQKKYFLSQRLAIRASNAFLASMDELQKELEGIEVTQVWQDPEQVEPPEQTEFGEVSENSLLGPAVPWSIDSPEMETEINSANSSIKPEESLDVVQEPEEIDGWALVPPISELEPELEEGSDLSEIVSSSGSDFSDDDFLAEYARNISLLRRSPENPS